MPCGIPFMHRSVLQGIHVDLDAGFFHPLSESSFVGVILLRIQQGGGNGFFQGFEGDGAFGFIAFIADDVISVLSFGLGRNIADLFQRHGGVNESSIEAA